MPATNLMIPREVLAEPTICGPVSDFKELTLTSNAYTLGWYGFYAGILTCILFFVGYVYIAPRVFVFGQVKGWWS